MNETNDTQNNTPAAYLVAEVCYYMAFFMLKKLLEQKILSPEICQQINVAVPKSTAFCGSIFSGCCNSYPGPIMIMLV